MDEDNGEGINPKWILIGILVLLITGTTVTVVTHLFVTSPKEFSWWGSLITMLVVDGIAIFGIYAFWKAPPTPPSSPEP